MPRYHFNVHDGEDYHDPTGAELPDLKAAREMAVRVAGDMLRDSRAFWNHEEWKVDVTDDAGLILFTLMFVAIDAPAAGTKGGG